MTRVAPVKLKNNHRTLWFDPGEVEVSKGDAVVVSTARGVELGYMADDVIEVDDKRIKELKSPLKPVERKADEADLEKAAEMERLSAEALPVFKEMAAATSEEMHPVSVEYLLDGEHAVFYFEAEERIDFRELVRKLASHFHVRVDMRQIGVRDEARMVGGLGHCGQELCCKRLGGEFCPVSIRMAKEQDLSLNPQKISGVCGRLMCCLRYEFDAYKEFKSRAPKKNATVQTPEGATKVVDLDVPREIVTLKTEDGQTVKVPLSGFDPAVEGARPNAVGEEAWEEATAPKEIVPAATLFGSAQQLSGKDKLAEPGAVRHTGSGTSSKKRSGSHDEKPVDTRKPRRRSKVSTSSDDAQAASGRGKKRGQVQVQGKASGADKAKSSGQDRKKGAAGDKAKQPVSGQSQKPKRRSSTEAKGADAKKPAQKQGSARPGRKSSALRQRPAQAPDGERRRRQASDSAQSGEAGAGRRSRRRSHKAHGHDESSAGFGSSEAKE